MNDSLALQPIRGMVSTVVLYTFVGGNKPSLDGVNEYRLEAYATLRRHVAAVGPGHGLPHDLVLSLDAPKSNVA
jgi:hypothetical protein